MYNLHYRKPPPFVPRDLRLEVPERLDHHGREHRRRSTSVRSTRSRRRAPPRGRGGRDLLPALLRQSRARAGGARAAVRALPGVAITISSTSRARCASTSARARRSSPPTSSRSRTATSAARGRRRDARASAGSSTSCSPTAGRRRSSGRAASRSRWSSPAPPPASWAPPDRGADRRAERPLPRHRRDDREVLADRGRPAQMITDYWIEWTPHERRLPDQGAGGRPRRDRQGRRARSPGSTTSAGCTSGRRARAPSRARPATAAAGRSRP